MTYLVNAIGYVHLGVADLDAAVHDATDVLGLHVTSQEGDRTYLSANGRRAELVLEHARTSSALCVGLEALSRDDVRTAGRKAKEAGCQIIQETPRLPFVEAGVTFATPDGHILEIHTPVPDSIYSRRHRVHGVGPTRIEHVNLRTPSPAETRELLTDVLGIRLSEKLADDGLSWMRGGNRQHHIFSIVRGETGLHHYAWEFAEFVDFQTLGDVLDRNGRQLLWGPGRHRPGDNIYAYYLDVSGAMVECSHGMAYVADDATFVPNVIHDLKRPDNVRTMNCWGTPAPQPWLEHHFPFANISPAKISAR